MFELWQDDFDGLNLRKLKVDQAYLNVTSTLQRNAWIYSLSDECVSCPYKHYKNIPSNGNFVGKIPTTSDLSFLVLDSDHGRYAYGNESSLCAFKTNGWIGHLGVYNLTISDNGCNFAVLREPANLILSIFAIIGICFIITALIKLTKLLNRRTVSESNEQLDENQTNESEKSSRRLSSLDTFRGLAIVSMIFANSGSGEFQWFEHATWNGIHPADFIFPSFLWIMGVCIPISIKSQITKNISRNVVLYNIFERSLKLFLIGLFIHTIYGPNVEDIRVMGVLQRFGIAYFVTATFYVFYGRIARSEEWEMESRKWRLYLYDIIVLIPQWMFMLTFVVTYLVIIFCLPVPGCPSGYLGPGGIHEGGKFNNCIGGAAGYIDRMILGENHLYRHGRALKLYDEKTPFDPEGPFGSLMTIVQVFFGVQCGQILLSYTDWKARINRWLGWSVGTLIIGLCICGFSVNNGLIPINKVMWSLSFVLVTTSFSFALLAIFYYVIDIKKWWDGKPLLYAGMNAIIMYAGSEVFSQMYPFYWRYNGMNTHFEFLLANIWTAAAWNFVGYVLYQKKICIAL